MIDNNYDAQSDPSQPEEGVGRVESLPKWPFPCCPLFFFFFSFVPTCGDSDGSR